MKFSPLVVFIVLLHFFSYGQTKYESNLDIIRDTSIYNAQVKEHPANQLVEIIDVVPHIKLDIRYATTNNFTGEIVYTSPKAFVRQPVANALKIVQKSLSKYGLGLVVFDAYRPYSATVKFYEIYKDTNFVASPWQGSRHNRGAAVDVSIIELETGEEIQMPTAYDDFTEMANPEYKNLPENVIKNREILMTIMQKHGFRVYPHEWWHYDFIGWEVYDLMDIPFDKIPLN